MQHEIREPQRLLNSSGDIAEPGFAKKLLWEYDRADIHAPKWRIKEWDYYYIGCQDYGLALTISDAGYVSSVSASFLTFGEHPTQVNNGTLGVLPLGKLDLPNTSASGDLSAEVGNAEFAFFNDGSRRMLAGNFRDYIKAKADLKFSIELSDMPEESMVIATPFPKRHHFYYNQKINCMRAKGTVSIGEQEYDFGLENNALATLDWGRGVWTYDNTWYWGSGQTILPDGSRFGFNIGYGFGDTSAASENMLFYNGKSHKLKDVQFVIPKKDDGSYDYMSAWKFTETDGRFEMDFQPVIDRQDPVDMKVICMIPHQVFGSMSGRAVLDDGNVIELKDCMVFAEHVHNKW